MEVLRMVFGSNDKRQYFDIRDSAGYILKTDEDVIYRWLGLRAFQIEQYGYYDPNVLLKRDWHSLGKECFKKYVNVIKSTICPELRGMKKSELLKDAIEIFALTIGILLAKDVPRALAIPIAAIVAKRGLDWLCRDES